LLMRKTDMAISTDQGYIDSNTQIIIKQIDNLAKRGQLNTLLYTF